MRKVGGRSQHIRIGGNDMELYMNMNIDDVIKALKNGEYLTDREQEQIAEWLEELKTLRLDSCMIHLPERLQLVENGYNKALNDFVNACEKQFITMYEQRYVDMRDIVNIAEQLKAGGRE